MKLITALITSKYLQKYNRLVCLRCVLWSENNFKIDDKYDASEADDRKVSLRAAFRTGGGGRV